MFKALLSRHCRCKEMLYHVLSGGGWRGHRGGNVVAAGGEYHDATFWSCNDQFVQRVPPFADCPFRVLSAPNEPTASPPSNPKRSDRLQRFVRPVWVIFRIFLLPVWCSMLCLRLPSRGVIVRWSWIWPALRWGPPSRQATPNKQTNCHSKPEPRRTSTSQVNGSCSLCQFWSTSLFSYIISQHQYLNLHMLSSDRTEGWAAANVCSVN